MHSVSVLSRFSALLTPVRYRSFLCFYICIFALCGCQILGRHGSGEIEPEFVNNPCIILVLPTSGQYANISRKIRQGAEAAQNELKKTGSNVRIENINTDSPDWLAQLQRLPESCAVVGGPLRDKSYTEARTAGLTQQRIFFAFTPNLQPGDEGKTAWRFFPSPQDQIDALLRFSADELNIRTYGALLPSDHYGRRMTSILETTLNKRQMPLQKSTYGAPTQAAITSALQPLLKPTRADQTSPLIPQTTFEALFLPDSWKRVDTITSALSANGEDRLVLLGTTLWEQGLAGKQVPGAGKYALAVFPGAWNPQTAPAQLKNQSGDFWTALGYDFIKFSAGLGLGTKPSPAMITSRAQKAALRIKAMAPIFWNADGSAHQQLYLFQITPAGTAPLDIANFKRQRTAIAQKAALKMQGWGHIDPVTGEAISEPAREAEIYPNETPISESRQAAPPIVSSSAPIQQTVTPSAPKQAEPVSGTIGTVPRSSYKLSLPGKK